MQTNAGAFDAWAIVLLNWMAGTECIEIAWESPVDVKNRHYQRFLYRARRLNEIMGDRIRIDEKALSKGSLVSEDGALCINIPLQRKPVLALADDVSERGLETWLADPLSPARASLVSRYGLVDLDRQFPVGLFKNTLAEGNKLFPGSKSAIDLVGRKEDGSIVLFELKRKTKQENMKVGALSEMLFYAMMLRDVALRRFAVPPGPATTRVHATHVLGAPSITGVLLTDARHPLLSDDLFQFVNDRTKRLPTPVELRTDVYRLAGGDIVFPAEAA